MTASATTARRTGPFLSVSYDQRNDNGYYIVTLIENGKEPRRFMAQVDVGWAGDDWTAPTFAARLRNSIDSVAREGTTNTSYSGPL